jgi:hypothetical protein
MQVTGAVMCGAIKPLMVFFFFFFFFRGSIHILLK